MIVRYILLPINDIANIVMEFLSMIKKGWPLPFTFTFCKRFHQRPLFRLAIHHLIDDPLYNLSTSIIASLVWSCPILSSRYHTDWSYMSKFLIVLATPNQLPYHHQINSKLVIPCITERVLFLFKNSLCKSLNELKCAALTEGTSKVVGSWRQWNFFLRTLYFQISR